MLQPREVRQIEIASRALLLLPSRAPAVALFDAIRPCVPHAAGLFSVIRPGAPDALSTHPVRLPEDVLESWLATPPEQLAATLGPLIRSRPGSLKRDSETIKGALRGELAVLGKLDAAGLGEGAGYKVLERRLPRHGAEHVMLALLMERGEAVPARAQEVLAALNLPIREAVQRLGLSILAHESILAQIVAEQTLGYICTTRRGKVLEANRRAHHLVLRYCAAARVGGRRTAMEAFAGRARAQAGAGRAWHLVTDGPPSRLEVNVHRLSSETHALPQDVVLVVLKEDLAPTSDPREADAGGRLTSRQQEIALLIARTSDSYKQIGERLGLSAATVRKHVENIHRLLGLHSRAEIVDRFK
jgi:DNA-binding CsgD family transcriptional regulator